MIDLLALENSSWAGIGALLAGAGSFLTGLAALRAARKEKSEKEVDSENPEAVESASD